MRGVECEGEKSIDDLVEKLTGSLHQWISLSASCKEPTKKNWQRG